MMATTKQDTNQDSTDQLGNLNYGHHNQQQQQTLPKSCQHQPAINVDNQSAEFNLSLEEKFSISDKLKIQANKSNRMHSCLPGSSGSSGTTAVDRDPNRKLSTGYNGGLEQRTQFLDSLSARRRFFSKITIEPLAFLAILALYIEFPSIQDLIYTKICLQIVANQPNVTLRPNVPLTLSDNNFNLTTTANLLLLPNDLAHITNSANGSSLPLPNEGRIIQNTDSPMTIINRTTIVPAINSSRSTTDFQNIDPQNGLLLCDRLNKTAVSKEIREQISNEDSLFWLKYQLIICLLCVISCPYWGGMSDKIGRLIPLNVPIVVAVLSNLLSLALGLLISLDYHSYMPIETLYLGAILTGLSGGQAIVIVNSFSFISDNTSNESRSKRVTILESVIYLSHSFGFLITKHVMSLGIASPDRPWFNRHLVSFSLCLFLNLFCVIYSVLRLRHHNFHRFMNNFEREHHEAFSSNTVLGTGSLGGSDSRQGISDGGATNPDRLRELTASTPDDLDGPIARSDKRWKSWGTLLTIKYYKQTYVTATKRRETRGMIQLLLLCGFLSAMSLACLMSLLYIYVRMDPFNWTSSQYSWWNSVTSITRGAALVALTLSMRFVKNWNVPDPLVAAVGFLSKGVGLLMIALAQSSSLINWTLLAFVMSEFSMPPIRSLLSKLVAKEEVGKVYSCLAALQSVCFLVGNIVFFLAYTSLELQNFFRLSFIVVACFEFLAVIIMLIVYTSVRNRVMII